MTAYFDRMPGRLPRFERKGRSRYDDEGNIRDTRNPPDDVRRMKWCARWYGVPFVWIYRACRAGKLETVYDNNNTQWVKWTPVNQARMRKIRDRYFSLDRDG